MENVFSVQKTRQKMRNIRKVTEIFGNLRPGEVISIEPGTKDGSKMLFVGGFNGLMGDDDDIRLKLSGYACVEKDRPGKFMMKHYGKMVKTISDIGNGSKEVDVSRYYPSVYGSNIARHGEVSDNLEKYGFGMKDYFDLVTLGLDFIPSENRHVYSKI